MGVKPSGHAVSSELSFNPSPFRNNTAQWSFDTFWLKAWISTDALGSLPPVILESKEIGWKTTTAGERMAKDLNCDAKDPRLSYK